ncbi:DUF1223 domain-containing protein [Simiduia agarivorans]|uniref:Secreted protein n=1 Tax=Simiduia agarivorans (strain DSM 21679 / JCM 13881 / BCRC 17597 / SA1) TaxID=1117647 RepID=K4KHU3_SIMAS|nr:DUF1223 domain-containing protein [Simiduia agarivorans]AFU97543.1 hypothetical protein M5M_01580 [Simiduia agarivorans SA1 = DSM 21679]
MRLAVLLLLTPLLTFAATKQPQVFHSAAPGQAQFIELYTSQGCSSCPPAERWLSEYQQHPALWQTFFPLAWHVDYWDHLGWKDQFSQPAFSRRQYLYHHQGNTKSVYTPQIIVDGKEWTGLLTTPRAELPLVGALTGTAFQATISDRVLTAQGEGLLNIALVRTDYSQRIYRGENAGRRLQQPFVVLGYTQVPSQDGLWQSPLPATTAEIAADAVVIWVTAPGNPTPLAIAGGKLKN